LYYKEYILSNFLIILAALNSIWQGGCRLE